MREPIIKLENVWVTYNKGKLSEVHALKNVNLEIYPEEYVIFFGPSGCGKSTLLYSMAGLETNDRGRVIVYGENLAELSQEKLVNYHRQQLGMVFQAFYLISSLSVIDNIMLPQMFLRKSLVDRKKLAMDVLKRFEIAEFASHLPTELSGGQQQRVALCRAVMNNPSIVFADEPVGNLDSRSSEKVMNLLYDLNTKDKKTVILVTHDPRYLHYAHRIFYIKDGEIVREVSNPERPQLREEKMRPFVPHALMEFARFYPQLDEADLKVKFLSHYLLDIDDEERQERLERLIRRRAANQISSRGFMLLANQPFQEGGVGLYEQTARKLADELETVVTQSRYLQRQFIRFPGKYNVLQEGIERVRLYILKGYTGHLTEEQSLKLDAMVKARLEGSIDHTQFRELLDRPVKDGGVGLHYQTAQEFSRRCEIVLIDYPKITPSEVIKEKEITPSKI